MERKGRQRERFEGQRYAIENKTHVLIREYGKFWGCLGSYYHESFWTGDPVPLGLPQPYGRLGAPCKLHSLPLFAGSIAAANIATWVGEDSDGSLS